MYLTNVLKAGFSTLVRPQYRNVDNMYKSLKSTDRLKGEADETKNDIRDFVRNMFSGMQ